MSIHLRHAAACYQAPDGEVEAVRDVSFDVAQGEFVSLVGPSRCWVLSPGWRRCPAAPSR